MQTTGWSPLGKTERLDGSFIVKKEKEGCCSKNEALRATRIDDPMRTRCMVCMYFHINRVKRKQSPRQENLRSSYGPPSVLPHRGGKTIIYNLRWVNYRLSFTERAARAGLRPGDLQSPYGLLPIPRQDVQFTS